MMCGRYEMRIPWDEIHEFNKVSVSLWIIPDTARFDSTIKLILEFESQ